MYQYDAASGPLPAGFSAINLSVKCVTTAQAQMKGAGPHTSPGGSVIDLSTSSVTTTSPQVSFSFFFCCSLTYVRNFRIA